MTRKGVAAASLLALTSLLFMLTGCTGQYLEMPQGASDISPCPASDTLYPVTDIGKHSMAPCDLGGDILVLPDKYEIVAPPQNLNEQTAGPSSIDAGPGVPKNNTFALTNLGTYGLVIGEYSPKTRKTQWWGTAAGLSLYWNAFGKTITPDPPSTRLPG